MKMTLDEVALMTVRPQGMLGADCPVVSLASAKISRDISSTDGLG